MINIFFVICDLYTGQCQALLILKHGKVVNLKIYNEFSWKSTNVHVSYDSQEIGKGFWNFVYDICNFSRKINGKIYKKIQ